MFQNLEVVKYIGLDNKVYYTAFWLSDGSRAGKAIEDTPNGWIFIQDLAKELAKAPRF